MNMLFEVFVDKDKIDKEMFRQLGVVFTEDYIRKILWENKNLLGSCAIGIDTYEREWLAEIISEDLTGLTIPCNGDSEEESQKFWAKWIDTIKTSDAIDREKSKEFQLREEAKQK